MKVLISLITLFTIGTVYAQSSGQLIDWFAGADIVGTAASTDADLNSDFYVREFEFSAFSTIDQTFDGVLTLAYHKELSNGDEHLEVHEAFIFSSKLWEMSTFKAGKFFLGFGRLNRFHRHDWIFTEAPLVQKSFFGNEGAKDTGFEYSRNFPDLYSSLTLGVTSGNEFNHNVEHDHDEDEHEHSEKAKAPTSYLRFAKFIEFSSAKGLDIGLNYVSRLDAESIGYQYSGVDLIFKNRVGKYFDWVVQSEVWSRKTIEEEETLQDMGAYIYLEKGLNQHHAIGLRWDYYKPEEHQEHEEEEEGHQYGIDGLEVEDTYQAIALSYIYTNSEFMRTRFTIEHGQGIHVEEDEDVDSFWRGQLQLVFSIGAHPAHVY